jgi:hypothetical protein
MNDRKEMTQFVSDLNKAVKEKVKYGKKGKVDSLFKKYCGKREDNIVYMMSFSSRSDDAAQWQRYAANGQGICIEFDYNCLLAYTRSNACKLSPIVLQRVFYPENESHHELVQIIADFIEDNSSLQKNHFDTIKSVFENAWACSIDHKHCSFSSEDKIRLSTLPGINYKRSNNLCYSLKGNNLNEHYELSIKNIYKNLIKRIIIGPKSSINTNVFQRYLYQYFCKNNLVKKSDCPLR